MIVSFVRLPNPFSVRYFTRHRNAINEGLTTSTRLGMMFKKMKMTILVVNSL
ncbi:hypothetical protein HanRHA438_Chr10g0459691 [Helianthus annuus]|nr:hypothetical protein HanRHA438_Chr10g0459691 [Helianthus annuus]